MGSGSENIHPQLKFETEGDSGRRFEYKMDEGMDRKMSGIKLEDQEFNVKIEDRLDTKSKNFEDWKKLFINTIQNLNGEIEIKDYYCDFQIDEIETQIIGNKQCFHTFQIIGLRPLIISIILKLWKLGYQYDFYLQNEFSSIKCFDIINSWTSPRGINDSTEEEVSFICKISYSNLYYYHLKFTLPQNQINYYHDQLLDLPSYSQIIEIIKNYANMDIFNTFIKSQANKYQKKLKALQSKYSRIEIITSFELPAPEEFIRSLIKKNRRVTFQ